MLNKRHILSALLASALAITVVSISPASAQAQSWGGRLDFQAQRSISPAEAKTIALEKFPGSKYVNLKRRGDTYSVRVITKSGKVVDVLIDVNTGSATVKESAEAKG